VTFIAGELAAVLRLNGKQLFDSGLADSGQKFKRLEALGQKSMSVIDSGLRTAGFALGTATAGAAALGASVFAAGASYNVLQQNSRVALGTLLGGAEKANAQMDKLDAFAKNSPFSKGVFIQAQQQMIGFGIETSKVIPYLDAIQNQVAAIGGSNQDIADVTSIVAKIRSSATLGQEDLNQLADKGINAAALIAEANGQTEQEFRDSIFGSPIKGPEALAGLDAMMESMQKKFGGTTSKVKEQWTGAADRIKAATRDIGATLARPFIDPNGGGQAVVWGNQVADVLRAIEKQTGPITSWAVGKLNPAFSRTSEILVGVKEGIAGLDMSGSNIDVQLGRLSTYAPGLAAVAGGLLAMGTQLPILARLGISINPVLGGILGLVAASPELRAAGKDFFTALSPLLPVASELAAVLGRSLASVLPIVADGITGAAEAVVPLVEAIADAPPEFLAFIGVAALLTLGLAKLGVTAGTTAAASSGLIGAWRGAQAAAVAAGTSTGIAATSLGVATTAAGKFGTAMKVAFLGNPIGLILTVITTAVGLFAAANADAEEKVAAHKSAVADFRGVLQGTTGDLEQQTRQMIANNAVQDDTTDALGKAGIASKTYVDAVMGSSEAQASMTRSLIQKRKAVVEGTDAERKAQNIARDLGISYETVIGASLGVGTSQREMKAAMEASNTTSFEVESRARRVNSALGDQDKASSKIAESMRAQSRALADAVAEQDAYNAAIGEGAAGMSAAELSNAALNESLLTIRDSAAEVPDRISAIKDALDELKGGAQSVADAERDLNETTQNLMDAFTQTDDAGKNMAASLVDGAGKIDTTTTAGRNLYDQVSTLNDEMLNAQILAYENAKATGNTAGAYDAAVAAAAPYQKALHDAGVAAGLSDIQIANMQGTLLATPEVTAFLLSDEGTIDQSVGGLIGLAQQIMSTPDKTITITEPMSPAVKKRLEDLGFTVKTMPDGKTITVTAPNGATVDGVLRSINANSNDVTKKVTTWYDVLYTNGAPGSNGAPLGIAKRPSANGNLFGSPGVAQAFANGGFPTGMYKAGPKALYKFAEPETRWEAFISGKPGQEDRNRAILGEAAERLGMAVVKKRQASAGAAGSVARVSGGSAEDAPRAPLVVQLVVTVDEAGVMRVVRQAATEAADDVVVELITDATGRR
jgi:tetrahydromethanopterin S-methyltransferase subunit G